MKLSFIILLLIGLHTAILAQSNRRVIIDLLLNEHAPKELNINNQTVGVNAGAQTKQRSAMFYNPLPKFRLPQGAIICRFEEYVQLHTPFKLNIGVGGE